MEQIVLLALVGFVWWWWRRRRRRARERQFADLRKTFGYSASGARKPKPGASSKPNAGASSATWADLLDRPDVLIIDTETTGLGERAEVIEVAALDTTGTLRFHALSLPEGPIPRDASRIHGLTRRNLKAEGARPWPEVHGELIPVLEGAAVLLAWNARFDGRLLEQTTDRHGLFLPELWLRDALEDYRELRGEAQAKGRHTLAAVVRRERVKVPGPAHRAEADCRMVLGIMRAVVESGGSK